MKKTVFLTVIFLLPLTISAENNINIWLKIFHKRDTITIKNTQGLTLNNDKTKKYKEVIIIKKGSALLWNNKTYTQLSIHPIGSNLTEFITKYGIKKYDGSFTISIKNKHLFIINKTIFSSYLKGVINAEMGDNFHIEALKTQAVLSRSYYFNNKTKFKHLNIDACDIDGHFQVYKGLAYISKKVLLSIKKTKNEIVVRAGGPFTPYFHSTSSGIILHPKEAWGDEVIKKRNNFTRYDGTLEIPNSQDSPFFKWNSRIKKEIIHNALQQGLTLNSKIKKIILQYDKKIILKNIHLILDNRKIENIKAYKLKSLLEKQGINDIKSVHVNIKKDKDHYIINGKGFGHLVGVSQWGAESLAKKGYNYRDIIKYYYPGTYIIDKNKQ